MLVGDVTIHRPGVGDLDALVMLAVDCQRTPSREIPYLGDDAASIAADIRDIGGEETWHEQTVVARIDGRVVGWLFAEHDAELGRVWWFGPFLAVELDDAAAATVADELYRAAAPLRAGFGEEEICYDERSVLLDAFGRRNGFVADAASLALRFDYQRDASRDGATPTGGVEIPRDEAEVAAVAALHDELFPGTHRSGDAVAVPSSSERVTWCRSVDGELAGYVAVEHHHDNSLYIDFLGVDPRHRRHGHVSVLIRHALGHGARLGVTHAHLTVRVENEPARRLYESLGFTEVMVIVPARKGFLLGPGDSSVSPAG